jgi:hypothetical protein
VESWSELEVAAVRPPARDLALLALTLVGLGLLLLVGLVGPVWLATQGEPLPAAALFLLVTLAVLLGTTELGLRRAARGALAALLEPLGARRLLVLGARDGRRRLRVEVRLGRSTLRLADVALEDVLAVAVTTLQGGAHAVWLDLPGGHVAETLTRERAGELVAIVERWRADAASSVGPRCAACHGGIAPPRADASPLDSPVVDCPGCSTRLHEACALELGRCPTLGCVHASPAPTGQRLELRLPPMTLVERVVAFVWLAAGGISAALLVRGLGAGGGVELKQGAALALVTLLPMALMLSSPLVALEALLGLLLGPGVRSLEVDEVGDRRVLRLGWRLGRLRLPERRLALPAGSRIEPFEESNGRCRVDLVRPTSPGREWLAHGQGLATLRQVEALLATTRSRPSNDAAAPTKEPPPREGLRK